jgi:hypothetical protein
MSDFFERAVLCIGAFGADEHAVQAKPREDVISPWEARVDWVGSVDFGVWWAGLRRAWRFWA